VSFPKLTDSRVTLQLEQFQPRHLLIQLFTRNIIGERVQLAGFLTCSTSC